MSTLQVMDAHSCTDRVIPTPGYERGRSGVQRWNRPIMTYHCVRCGRLVSPARLFRKPTDVLMRVSACH